MVPDNGVFSQYFVFGFPLSEAAWRRFDVEAVMPGNVAALDDPTFEIRKLADRINRDPGRQAEGGSAVPAEILLALRTLNQALRHVATQYFQHDNPGCLARCRQWGQENLGEDSLAQLHQVFVELFPPVALREASLDAAGFLADKSGPVSGLDQATLEMMLLFLNVNNPAATETAELFDDEELRLRVSFVPFITSMEDFLNNFEPPGSEGTPLFQLLRDPMLASPDSLAGQIRYIRDHWGHLLPAEFMLRLQFALDVLKEIDVARGGAPGPPPVLEFGPGSAAWGADAPEPEAFSHDADWMSNVVLMAKSVYVWLDQISRWYGHPVRTLNEIPDQELDRLAGWGVTGLWLIGLWERSEASRLIKQYMGNPEAAASAYALRDYRIADDLGGEDAWRNLSERAGQRGIRLASDMVPNHMGIDSRWVIEHPEFFLQLDHAPYPAYNFTGGDLCDHPGVAIRIEDGYWNHSDAAVVFQRVDEASGHVRYIYHGNDGTSMPWNDTAQLNFLLPEVREAVIQVILDVARRFPIIRFDAAMTLAKKHFHRLWFPQPGDAGAIPSRAEHGLSKPDFDTVFPVEFWREVVDRVATEAPDTLLLAEAFWLMEGYFVRTLGMHRVYNSAFMNMLKMEDNAKYRQTIKNVLEFSPEVLKRFVNFMNNPDEKTAVEQFGKGDKYFGCMLLLVTMPGLPMLGHGQIEGFSEKYGMEYRKAYWDEHIDHDMVHRHEREIFPMMRRRHLFSGSENFALFDFQSDGGWIDENVFAYTNRHGSERALIIFNNSYESTAGTLRISTAINVGAADHPHLMQKSLTESLGIDASADVWYIMRDHIDGLEYLRSGVELANRGFHTHLNGYQYRALIDFRAVTDTDGLWGQLAEHLAGRGALDLGLAKRRLVVGSDLAMIRQWMDPAILAWLETSVSQPLDSSAAEVEEPDRETVQVSVEPPVDLPDDLIRTAHAIRDLDELDIPENLGRRSRRDLQAMMDSLTGSRIPQAVYLCSVLRKVSGPRTDSPDSPAIGGLNLEPGDLPLVLEDMGNLLHEWTGHDYAGRSAALLAEILAGTSGQITDLGRGKARWFGPMTEDDRVARFLGFNDHEGTTWLNREALESLLTAMVVCGMTTPGRPRLASLLDGRAIILEAAEKAGYSLAKMLQLIAPK